MPRTLPEASMEMMDVAYLKGREADKNLSVTFSYQPHLNQAKSATEGRPIYDDREYVTIKVPGDKDSVVERPVTDIDRRRFHEKYQHFKAGNVQTQSGTPLSAVAWLSRGRVRELEFFNVHTLEQLANLPDAHAQQFMGIASLRQSARDHLMAATEAAPITRMRAEMDAKDSEIAALRNSISEQGNMLAAMQRQLQILAQNATGQQPVATVPVEPVQEIRTAPTLVAPSPRARIPGQKNADRE